ncbi:hypothetical protein BTS2_2994 [Bacillus sp. TS-2]|nr:hypothetical protein BTS2_2994 [Bacillus sp. TS-2]
MRMKMMLLNLLIYHYTIYQTILKKHLYENYLLYYGYVYLEYNNEVILDSSHCNALDVYWGYLSNIMIYDLIEQGYKSDFISGESEPYELQLTNKTVEFTINEKTFSLLPKYEFLKVLLEEEKYYIEFHNDAMKDKEEEKRPLLLTNELLLKVEEMKPKPNE